MVWGAGVETPDDGTSVQACTSPPTPEGVVETEPCHSLACVLHEGLRILASLERS